MTDRKKVVDAYIEVIQQPLAAQALAALQEAEEKTLAAATLTPMRYDLAVEDYVEGTQNLNREDLQIPQLVLVQAQSKNVSDAMKHVGELYNNLTGEFKAEINAVLLSEAKGRVCFARAYDGNADPLCGSDDAIAPRSEYVGTIVRDDEFDLTVAISGEMTCMQCPLSQFGANSEPPMCAKSYSYAMIDTETGIPFVMRASRSATGAAKQLNTIAKTLGRRKYIKITSRAVESDKGNYFLPVFQTNGDTESELKQYALKYSIEVGNIAKRAALTDGAPTKQIAPKELPF
jgi:hypothetical protein